jgi:hypothetical protein
MLISNLLIATKPRSLKVETNKNKPSKVAYPHRLNLKLKLNLKNINWYLREDKMKSIGVNQKT